MSEFRFIAESILQKMHELTEGFEGERENFIKDRNNHWDIEKNRNQDGVDWRWKQHIQQKKNNNVSINELGDWLLDQHHHQINFYPSNSNGSCCDLAVFLSMTSKKYKKTKDPRNNLNCILDALSKHMQGDCAGMTNKCVIITDNWDADVWDNYKSRIKQVMNNAYVEIYMISDPYISEIELS
ncbi:hypothetical protein A3Q34_04805 [Colwellia sp. PAMC 20917]|nr:hypothetical protein A3Q34_04805 [Colwellia sp. PAMC 20917]